MTDNSKAIQKHSLVMNQKAMFQKYANELTEALDNILYVVIATDDGFPVAYTNMNEKDATGKAALAASLDGLCATVAQESELERANAIHIVCETGFVFSHSIKPGDATIVVLVGSNKENNIATLLWHINKLLDGIMSEFPAS